jgi:hypothetical protein
VMGSSRATVYKWQVDLQSLTAEVIEQKRRQLYPMDKRLNVKPIAEELVKAIIGGIPDERLAGPWLTIAAGAEMRPSD